MLDFITAPLITGIVFAGIYGLVELYARRKERIMIIEKLAEKTELSADKKVDLGFRTFSFSALKAGCLLTGLGLGLLIGFFITYGIRLQATDYMNRETMSIVYGSTVLLFGGLGLLLAFIIELKLKKNEEERKEHEK